jgi:hypothetical protein
MRSIFALAQIAGFVHSVWARPQIVVAVFAMRMEHLVPWPRLVTSRRNRNIGVFGWLRVDCIGNKCSWRSYTPIVAS